MRLQLNLNKYYEGLDYNQINTLFRLFINAKQDIKRTKEIRINASDVDETLKIIYKANTIRSFRSIDDFMKSIGKEPIFEVEKLKEKAGGSFAAIDEMPLVEKYDFLMLEIDN